jgi:cyclohexanecarboxylate-CoA ligase
VNHPDAAQLGASLRVFCCGGADVPPDLMRRADETLGCCTVRVYGSSEFPTVTGGGFADRPDRRTGTDGRVIGAAQLRVIGEDGGAVSTGTAGELEVRGPEMFLGYLDASLDEAAFAPDGWFRTGDLGVVDGEGYLTIVGRKKDIIIRGGENLSVKEIEDTLFEHAAVHEVAVVGQPDPVLGERVCAFVVPAAGATPDLGDLADYLAARGLARQKFPERVVLVDALPKTPSGKTQKFRLREWLRTEQHSTTTIKDVNVGLAGRE